MRRLLVLSLDRTPAAELFGACVESWADALWPGRAWQEADAERIAEGFRRLSATHRQWPAPADLLTALPARAASMPALPRHVADDDERARTLQHLADVAAKLGVLH